MMASYVCPNNEVAFKIPTEVNVYYCKKGLEIANQGDKVQSLKCLL